MFEMGPLAIKLLSLRRLGKMQVTKMNKKVKHIEADDDARRKVPVKTPMNIPGMKDKIKQKERLLKGMKKISRRIAGLEKRGAPNLDAETLLVEKEKRFQQVVENIPVMIIALDVNGNILAWNKECERVTGYSAVEIVGNPNAMEILYPGSTHRERMINKFYEDPGDYRDWEWILTCKDGSKKITSWSNIPFMMSISPGAIWSVGVDITKWKHAVEA